MSSADFEKAKMRGINLSRMLASVANFKNADLRDTDFSGSDLSGADFTGAILDGVVWPKDYNPLQWAYTANSYSWETIMARRKRTREQTESAQERFSDNPFFDPVSIDEVTIIDDPNRTTQPSARVKFPADWTEEQKDAYFSRLRRAASRLKEKERESGVPFEGETILLRR